MRAMAAKGTLERTHDALSSPDFRRLFLVRLASQFADGLFQVSLIASVVFSPDKQSTTIGLFKATLVIALPYSVIGPFTGVFIDRWRRRRILVVAPWVKTAARLAGVVRSGPRSRPVLLRRVARDLGEPLLPGDRAGRRAAPGPDRGPADGELPRDRRRHGRVARRRLPGRSESPTRSGTPPRSSARARCGWSARGWRRGSATTWRRTRFPRIRAAPSRAAPGRSRVRRRDRAPLPHAEGHRTGSRRSRSTSWARAWC